jgi:hypothetical protein
VILTPLQALWVGLGLSVVMPRLVPKVAWRELGPHWVFALGLAIAFLVFGYFCAVQLHAVW